MRWGTAVIGMRRPIVPPTTAPIAKPTAIHRYVTMCGWKSVPTTATNIPKAASDIPERAHLGELRPFSPSTNIAAERM